MSCQVGARGDRCEQPAPPRRERVVEVAAATEVGQSSDVSAFADAPPGLARGPPAGRQRHHAGSHTSPTRARARTAPRSLNTRTTAPSAIPRGAASSVDLEQRLALAGR